ncbi:unnamed protein product, partial [Adineta steineri]
MFPSTTQETLIEDEIPMTHAGLLRSISALGTNDFNEFIADQYGGCWGTLKFEDTLSDYSNDARSFFYVDDNIDLHVLRQFMINEWQLQS